MKALAFLILFSMAALVCQAGRPYRVYLLSQIVAIDKPVSVHAAGQQPVLGPAAYIPRFERPKGAVFCRMEDAVTKSTKVWLKIGVQ